MSVTLLRRRGLGKSTCNKIQEYMQNDISVVYNERQIPNHSNILIRWGCSATVPSNVVINKATSIHEVNDKYGFRMKMLEHNLCPKTAATFNPDDPPWDGWFPIVVRPRVHSRGRGFHLVEDEAEYWSVHRRFGSEGYYVSEYVEKAAEYRVMVANQRVVWVARKFPANDTDVVWNHHRGARFENVKWGEWPLSVVRRAVDAMKLTELHFGGVDVAVSTAGRVHVLEVNSAPSTESDYRAESLAEVLDYMIYYGDEPIPLIQRKGGWRKFIHPAISSNALLIEDENA